MMQASSAAAGTPLLAARRAAPRARHRAPLAAAALWSATGSYDAVLLALIGGATVLALGFWTAAAISRRPGQGVQD